MAYRAEIEIGVKGTEKLRDLRNTIDELSTRVQKLDSLADVFKAPIQSIKNYNQSLQTAVETLNKVELGTADEVSAINTYIRALREANSVQERQNRIIQDTIKLQEEEARVQRLTAAGIFETTRFKQPIGPTRPSGVVPAGGFPTAGPLPSPGFQRTQKQVGKFGENLALGAGFPLLFGGGPGAVTGSVLGSFVGSGFGGQILGGAIGQIVDQTITKVATLGTAIQQLNFKALEESGLRLNANLQTQVQLLQQVGKAVEARQLIEQQVQAVTGALPGTVVGISDAVNVLTSAWNDFTSTIGVTLGILGAPFAAALGVILNTVTLIFKGVNVILSALGAGLKTTGEWVAQLIGGEEAVKRLNEGLKANNQEIQNARAEYLGLLSDLNGQVLLNRAILDLEKQKRAPNTTVAKEYNAALTEQQNILRINADYDDQIRKQNEKITDANKLQVEQAVRLLNVKRNQAIEEEKIKGALQQQQLQYQAQQEAARAAKALAEEQARAQRAVTSIQKDILQTGLERLDVQYNLDTLQKGEYAILKDRIQNAQKELDLKNIILQKEESLALAAAKTPEEQQYIVKLYEQKAALLSQQANLQNILNYNKAVELKYAQDLLTIQNKSQVNRAGFAAKADIASARQALAVSTGGVQAGFGFAQEALNAQQSASRAALDEQLQKITLLQQTLPKLSGDAAIAQQIELDKQIALYDIEVQRLDTLSALEQQQLRVNQVTAQYGDLASGIGDAFGTSFKGIIDGSQTAQQALAGFFQSVANSFLDMAAKIIAEWIKMTILNSILSLFPGSTGVSKGLSNLNASASINNPLGNLGNIGASYRATGGPVSAGKPYIVGEKGPELFMPRNSGTIIPNNAMGGGSTNVVVNVDASGSSVQGDQSQAKQLGLAVSAAVQAELVKQQRPGGLLYSR